MYSLDASLVSWAQTRLGKGHEGAAWCSISESRARVESCTCAGSQVTLAIRGEIVSENGFVGLNFEL